MTKLRNFEQGRRLLPVLGILIRIHDVPKWKDSFDRLRKALEPHAKDGDLNQRMLDAHRATTDTLIADARAHIDHHVEKSLEEYESAPCAPGRLILKEQIVAFSEDRTSEKLEERLRRLFRTARSSEPTSEVKLSILGDPDRLVVYRDEGRCEDGRRDLVISMDRLEPKPFRVFPGDEIRLVPKGAREEKKTCIGTTKSFENSIFAVHAELNGKELGVGAWVSIALADLELANPKSWLVLEGKETAWDDGVKLSKTYSDADKALGQIIFHPSAELRIGCPMAGFYTKIKAQFTTLGLSPRWISGTAPDAVLVLLVPK